MKTEIRKSLSGWQFWITLCILCCITLYCGGYVILYQFNQMQHIRTAAGMGRNPLLAATTLYNRWIGAEWMTSLSSLYFFIFPLAAAIPYGLSLYQERRSGYMAQMILRETRGKYLREKFIAVFLSGGLVITVPVILNIMLVALYFPAYTPDLNLDIYYAVQPFSFGSRLFYEIPWLYLCVRVALIFWYGGVAASISMAATFFTRNRFVILFSPILFFLLLNYSYTLVRTPYEMSPQRFLGAGNIYIVTAPVVIGEAALLSALTVSIIWLRGRMKDVL